MAADIAVHGGERVAQAGELRLARVESVRALAALGVVVGHLWATAHAFQVQPILGTLPRKLVFGFTSGVWVFFGLTGYLLFWPFVRRQFNAGSSISVGRYALNRALRILPLYWFSVVFLLLFQVHDPTKTLAFRHLLLLQNFWRDSIGRVNAPIWSVVVEVQFYALLPLLAWALFRLAPRSRLRAFGLLAVLAGASIFARQRLALDTGDTLSTWLFQLPTTFAFFVAGMSVALLRSAWEEQPPAWTKGPLGAPWLWLAASIPFWVLASWHFDLQNLLVAGVFLAVGAIVLPIRAWRGLDVLDWRPLALLGVVSYSLYVWHAPLILRINGAQRLMDQGGFGLVLVAVVPLCVVIAVVSYVLIERPGLRLRRRWA